MEVELKLYRACYKYISDIYSLPILVYVAFLVGSVIACLFVRDRLWLLFIFMLICLMVLISNIHSYIVALRDFEYSYCKNPVDATVYFVRIKEPYNKCVIECEVCITE